jgi:hypothetical protein
MKRRRYAKSSGSFSGVIRSDSAEFKHPELREAIDPLGLSPTERTRALSLWSSANKGKIVDGHRPTYLPASSNGEACKWFVAQAEAGAISAIFPTVTIRDVHMESADKYQLAGVAAALVALHALVYTRACGIPYRLKAWGY